MQSHHEQVSVAHYVYTEYFREMNAADQDVYAAFAGQNTGCDKFLYVYGLLDRYGWLPQKVNGAVRLSPAHRRWRKRLKRRLNKSEMLVDMNCSTAGKNSDASDACRSRGNEAFRAKDYEEALRLYTAGTTTAAIDSVNYALSVANRSAALYHLKEYEHCLRDVEQALASGQYPSHNTYKLLERKANCYRHTNRLSQALKTYSNCLLHLNSTQLSLAEKEITQTRITECIRKCQETEATFIKNNTKYTRLSKPKNSDISAMTNCVEIKYLEEMGRGLFVPKDIKPGEILIMEKPFAGVYKNNTRTHNCNYCFKQCLSAIPCPKCSLAMYCDKTCLEKAYRSHHNVECLLVYPLKGDPTIEPVHDLALRCFIQLTNIMGVDRYCSAVRAYHNGGDADGADGARDPVFQSVYGLDGNESRRTVANMFSMHCTASMIVSVLLLNGFCVPPDGLGTVGESLVHLLCVSNLNSHASSKPVWNAGRDCTTSTSDPSRFAATLDMVALVLCPTYSLINHSCDPNVIVQTHDGVEVIRAMQPISKGSQLFTDYGVNFMSHNQEDRNKHLWNEYRFHCQCQACTENWPNYASLELDELYISNPLCLDKSNQLISIPDMTLTKFNEIVHLLLTQKKISVNCLDFLFSFLDLLYSYNLKKPCIIYYKCVQIIHKCLHFTSD